MANYNTGHLEREIESLRRQLIKERDERQYEDSVRITTVIKQAEIRVLERCIVECMEEANAIPYSDDERIAILTAAERLKEMRDERVKEREGAEHLHRKQQLDAQYQRMLRESMRNTNVAYRAAVDQATITGRSITSMVLDEAATVRWSNISNPKEWT